MLAPNSFTSSMATRKMNRKVMVDSADARAVALLELVDDQDGHRGGGVSGAAAAVREDRRQVVDAQHVQNAEQHGDQQRRAAPAAA